MLLTIDIHAKSVLKAAAGVDLSIQRVLFYKYEAQRPAHKGMIQLSEEEEMERVAIAVFVDEIPNAVNFPFMYIPPPKPP